MNIATFLSSNYALTQQLNISEENICYIAKLTNLTQRAVNQAPAGRFGSMMQGFGNFVNNTVGSFSGDVFLVRTTDFKVHLVSEKNPPMSFDIGSLQKKSESESGIIKITLLFPGGSVETAVIKLTADNFEESFGGKIASLLSDFDSSDAVSRCHIFDGFAGIRISSQPLISSEAYKLETNVKSDSVIGYSENEIFLYNEKKVIPFEKILVCSKQNGYMRFVFEKDNSLNLAEIYDKSLYKADDLGLNIINTTENNAETIFDIPIADKIIQTSSFLSLIKVNTLILAATDSGVLTLKNSALYECGIFEDGDDIYVKTIDGETRMHQGCQKITEVLTLIPSYSDNIFKDTSVEQPIILNGQLTQFRICDDSISSPQCTFRFEEMNDFHFSTTKFSSTLKFSLNGSEMCLVTSNSLGVLISNMQEKVNVASAIEGLNINQLYDYYFKRNNKNFMAGTFAEIFKTNKLLNNGSDLNDIISALRSQDSEVLRNAFKSLVGKFKNVDDLQSQLIEKISLMEIQRKRIQKISDEWTLYYPHFMAMSQVAWLRSIFAPYVSEDMLQNEYWKCVANFKKILSGTNAYIQKSMNEIGACINPLSSALPDDVKRADITSSLRVNAISKTDMLKTGSDLLLAASTAAELTVMISRGLGASNTMMVAMSAKSIIDSYSKDVNMRKNIKVYGTQALEWWKIAMKGIQIQILEISHAVNEYNKACLKRDTDLFVKVPDSAKPQVKEKLLKALKGKINGSIDEKFLEILPQLNVRITDIIEDIDLNSGLRDDTLNSFRDNLYI